jgi:4-carboxymuconolactone decarboxylase
MTTKSPYQAGMQLREDMWGEAGAAQRVNQATPFNRPFEDLVTSWVFGDVWQRPGLDRRNRSMITLAALTALSKPNQLKMHVQGALANGVSPEEIREILIHTAVYAGIPTGVEAFRAARETLEDLGITMTGDSP